MLEKDLKERMGIAENNIVTLYKNDTEINKVLDKVRNRLPVWATLLFAVLCSLSASLATIVIK